MMVDALPSWIGAQLSVIAGADLLVVLAMLALMRLASRLGMWAYAALALPGTFAHEMAHYLVALLLFAKPDFPSLVPQRTLHGWRLGSVTFRAGFVRALPIALAPIVLLPLAVWWMAAFMAPATGWVHYLHAWIAAALVSASLHSSADFKLALPALAVIAIAALAYAYLT